MNDNEKGGPAFPLQSIGPDFVPGYSGMTLRDYFAAKAMQSILSTLSEGIRLQDCVVMSADAYTIADAMLKARNE